MGLKRDTPDRVALRVPWRVKVLAAVAVLVCDSTLALAQAGPPGAQPAAVVPSAPADAPLPRHGFTAELNLGVGFAYLLGGDESATSGLALAGLDVGIGGWLTPWMAMTFRIAGVAVNTDDSNNSTHEFIGPSLQYWPSRHVWIGGGIGLSLLHESTCPIAQLTDGCALVGFGVDARVGYSWFRGNQSVNVSVELNPGVYGSDAGGGLVTGFTLLFGYQYL
jgi:hypothetical protein